MSKSTAVLQKVLLVFTKCTASTFLLLFNIDNYMQVGSQLKQILNTITPTVTALSMHTRHVTLVDMALNSQQDFKPLIYIFISSDPTKTNA